MPRIAWHTRLWSSASALCLLIDSVTCFIRIVARRRASAVASSSPMNLRTNTHRHRTTDERQSITDGSTSCNVPCAAGRAATSALAIEHATRRDATRATWTLQPARRVQHGRYNAHVSPTGTTRAHGRAVRSRSSGALCGAPFPAAAALQHVAPRRCNTLRCRNRRTLRARSDAACSAGSAGPGGSAATAGPASPSPTHVHVTAPRRTAPCKPRSPIPHSSARMPWQCVRARARVRACVRVRASTAEHSRCLRKSAKSGFVSRVACRRRAPEMKAIHSTGARLRRIDRGGAVAA